MTILMITDNTKDEALICLETIRKYSDIDDLNIIVVDNASTDGTGEAMSEVLGITYIYMDEGKCSFAKIFNDVVRELKINDDLLVMGQPLAVCPHTLSNIKKALEVPGTAIACGMGNSFGGYQLMPSEISNYAEAVNKTTEKGEELLAVRAMSAFSECFLIKGECLEQLGEMDEEYNEIVFAVQDYCIKAVVMDKNILINMSSYFWQPAERVIFDYASGSEYALDMAHRDKIWGVHYFIVLGNPNLLTMIDKSARDNFKILEVGCDCGGSLLMTKNYYPYAELYGTDINGKAVDIAKHVCTAVTNNIEDKNLPFDKDSFDFIVFGDVLEHLRDPLSAIKYCRELLTKDGCIIASVPNLMHISVMEGLLQGNFTYEEAGLLDKTHIHMFTYKEMMNMFDEAGFVIEDVNYATVDITDKQRKLIDSLMELSEDVDRYMYETFQYVIRARKVG